MTLPVFADDTGNWVTMRNGMPPDSAELKTDNQQCRYKAALKYPLTSALKEQSDQDEMLISLGQQLREQLQAAQDAQRIIQEKESARITGNPFGWLTGQLTLEEDYRRYNRAADAANLSAQSITALTNAKEAIKKSQADLGLNSIHPSNPSDVTQDDTARRRFDYYYSCMTALGYYRVLIPSSNNDSNLYKVRP